MELQAQQDEAAMRSMRLRVPAEVPDHVLASLVDSRATCVGEARAVVQGLNSISDATLHQLLLHVL